VRERAGLASGDVSDEPARPALVAAQAFVFRTVLPGNTTLIRMRNNWVGDPSDPQVEINALADELSPVCGEGGS
jgi:hypothetical protein